MKPLPKPPPFNILKLPAQLFKHFRDPAMQGYLAKANTEYLHWEKIKYVPPPAGISAEDAWALIKVLRVVGTPLPLADIGGRPFTYWLPPATQELLHEIDQNASGNLELGASPSEGVSAFADRVLVNSLIDEAIATSKIEGAVTTWRMAEDMLRSGRKATDRSEQMILNSYRMIQNLRSRLDEPLSVELLHQMHSDITANTLNNEEHAGRFRSSTDLISVVDNETGEVVYDPPPAASLVARMQKLIDFANHPSDGAASFIRS